MSAWAHRSTPTNFRPWLSGRHVRNKPTEDTMAESRTVKVTLTAEVDQYVQAMERAAAATTGLADALRACGITEEQMPEAIRTTLQAVRDIKAA